MRECCTWSLIAGPWAYTDVPPEDSDLPADVAAAADELAAVVVWISAYVSAARVNVSQKHYVTLPIP